MSSQYQIIQYDRKSVRPLFTNEAKKSLAPLICAFKKKHDINYDGNSSCASSHLHDGTVCPTRCRYEIPDAFYENGKYKFTQDDIEWYYIPHRCDLYNVLVRHLVLYAFPDHTVDILYNTEHFVCYDRDDEIIYDLLYDLPDPFNLNLADWTNKHWVIPHDEIETVPYQCLYEMLEDLYHEIPEHRWAC